MRTAAKHALPIKPMLPLSMYKIGVLILIGRLCISSIDSKGLFVKGRVFSTYNKERGRMNQLND